MVTRIVEVVDHGSVVRVVVEGDRPQSTKSIYFDARPFWQMYEMEKGNVIGRVIEYRPDIDPPCVTFLDGGVNDEQ